jgi:hypothetical protein
MRSEQARIIEAQAKPLDRQYFFTRFLLAQEFLR